MSVLLFTFVGCGGASTGRVTGKVSLKGRAVPFADVVFVKQGGDQSPPLRAATNGEGTFTLAYQGTGKIPMGKYDVTVTWWTMPDGSFLPTDQDGEAAESLKETSPKYTKNLTQEIVTGNNDIELKVDG